MVGEQADLAREQLLESGAHLRVDDPWVAIPEHSVMNEQKLGTQRARPSKQLERRRDAAGDSRYLLRADDLHPDRRVVGELLDSQQIVGERDDLVSCWHDATVPRRPVPFASLGVWRSLVARAVRVGEVPGSNPGTPIETAPLGVVFFFRWEEPGGISSSAMSELTRVACVQINAGEKKEANLEKVEPLVERAASLGAEIVVLPEKWNALGSPEVFRAAAEPIESGESFSAMAGWAKRLGLTLVGGSVTEERSGRDKLSNTCPVYGPDGSLIDVYRKIHMFDVVVGGQSYRESEAEEPGEGPVVCEGAGWKLGLTICYDLRFPELYRIETLQGAELITVPAAFTLFTGKDHWELLLRARAVENQLYVAAANQWGKHEAGKSSYGRSLIVDPWGVVLAAAPDEDCVIVAEIDRRRMSEIRSTLPSLANRQPATYRWPAEA